MPTLVITGVTMGLVVTEPLEFHAERLIGLNKLAGIVIGDTWNQKLKRTANVSLFLRPDGNLNRRNLTKLFLDRSVAFVPAADVRLQLRKLGSQNCRPQIVHAA